MLCHLRSVALAAGLVLIGGCGGQQLSTEEGLDLVECSPRVAGSAGVVPRKICEERGGLALTPVPYGRTPARDTRT